MEPKGGETQDVSLGVSFPIALHPVLNPGDSGWVLALPPNRTEAAFRSDFGGFHRRLSPAAPEGPEPRRQLLIAAAPLPRNFQHSMCAAKKVMG
jgi:hypothetical protein